MELSGVPTPRMDWESSNLPESWDKFQGHMELIFKGPLKGKDEEEQVTYMLLWVGDRGRDIHKTWNLSADDTKKIAVVTDKFRGYVRPKLNPVFGRYKFYNEVQGSDNIETFLTRLRLSARDCNFTDTEEMIRDRIVFGTNSQKVRERLINEGADLTLDKAIQIAQGHQYSQEQLRTMETTNGDIHAIRRKKHNESSDAGRRAPKSTSKPWVQPRKSANSNSAASACRNCGYTHTKFETCRAKGQQCDYCKKWHHFASVCIKKKRDNARKSVNVVNCDDVQNNGDSEDGDSDFFVDSVVSNPIRNGQAFVEFEVGPKLHKINFKIDTGSQVNILPEHLYRKLGITHVLQKPTSKLSAYNGGTLESIGFCNLSCKRPNIDLPDCKNSIGFHVVNTDSPPILDLNACLDLDLVKLTFSIETNNDKPLTKEAVLSQYADAFKGIGIFSGEYTIQLDPDAKPVVHPPRRVPVALRERLKQELERMEQNSIIAKVHESTDWVNSMVVVEKPQTGKLRVCLDPHDLNKAILRPHYPMRTLEDVLPDLAGSQYFTKLDTRSAYWTCKLSDESSILTTFNSPYGRYRYLRLPYGLKSSQDVYQRKIDECLEGLEGVISIVDDVIVHGCTRQEHDQNLHKVLRRMSEKGVKLNEDKLAVGVSEVPYFGHILTAQGIKPDPSKVSAIKDMDPPQNRGELETFLGMVNYLSKFAPNLAEITSPLRKLLAKHVLFSWDKPQSDAFQKVKDVITQSPVLSYYDANKPLTLQTDASRSGLGCVLMQEGKPIAYASKTLTSAESKYAMIELELFGILFGVKRFNSWCYGRTIHCETDHLPLIAIMRKPLHACPVRLQRMLLQLKPYDLHVRHVPGKNIPVADTLSRKSVPDTYPGLIKGMDAQVHAVLSNLPVSDRKLQEIASYTACDSQMIMLKQQILQGWPDRRKMCPPEIIDFWTYREELTLADDLIMKGHKLIIPTALRPKMLEAVHASHQGISKCLSRGRQLFYWPNISADITRMVQGCSICLEHRNSNAKEPLISHEVPQYPWQTVATDLFTWNDKDFLVTVDYYSRYFEVQQLHSTKSKTVIAKLKSTWARHGIPNKVVSDGGPQYTSQEFADFAKQWDFTHVTSSPRYPKSNGLAEKTVGTVKCIFTKAKAAGTDPYLGILEYRTTPITGMEFTPSQLLMARILRSTLPATCEQLLPYAPNVANVRTHIKQGQLRSKSHYDKNAKPLEKLDIGESVRIQNQKKMWKPATVIRKHDARSYTVQTADGARYRRNRHFLLKTRENSHVVPCGNDVLPVECDTKTTNSQPPGMSEHCNPTEINTGNASSKPPSPHRRSASPTAKSPAKSSPYVTKSGRIVKKRIMSDM